ncbi:MAG: DUF3575 domain-containing protein [Ectothiorhodospiraceae bacterium]|nr:DUF3575 domain-containing protein [Ectothiorhodospiraceae bacterium]
MSSNKCTLFILVLLTIASNVKAEAEEEKAYDWSTSIGDSSIQIRSILSRNQLIYFGPKYFLFKNKNNFSSQTNHSLGFTAGYRYYLKREAINHYLDHEVSFFYTSINNGKDSRSYGASLKYGIEKFISKKISIEGSAGPTINYQKGSSYDFFNFSLLSTRIAINYYF